MSGLEGLLTGQTLVKRYRIREVIGRGGFAAVYRADDERLGRPVAVKVITIPAPDAESTERHRERFEREARAAASLPQHPNVVTVHDYGIDPVLGLDFLVMEFLHGEDLATHLQRHGRPTLEQAMRILRDAAAGIAVGHRAGIVHRDVKPGNIFLARGEGADGLRVCILDFGIAKVITDEHTLTGGGGEGIPLSPAYASPEQTHGVRDLTPASDVFSLGVVGYQLLTGEKPFLAPRGLDPADWIPRHSIRELNPQVPEWLEAVLRRALAFAPEDRFADADDFAAALAAPYDPDETLLAAPPLPVHPRAVAVEPPDETLHQGEPQPFPVRDRQGIVYGDRPERRRRSKVGPIAFLVMLLAAGAAGWWYLSGRSNGANAPAFDTEVLDEAIEEDDGDAAEEPVEAAPAPAPDDAVEGPPEPGLPPGAGLPLDTTTTDGIIPDTILPDTAVPDTGAVPPDTSAPDTATIPPDTVQVPPPVLGVPVDSIQLPAAATEPSGGPGAPPPPRSPAA